MLDQTTDLKSLLSRPDLVCEQAFVAGEWTAAKDGQTFDVINPARGDVIATVPDLSRVVCRSDCFGRRRATRVGKPSGEEPCASFAQMV